MLSFPAPHGVLGLLGTGSFASEYYAGDYSLGACMTPVDLDMPQLPSLLFTLNNNLFFHSSLKVVVPRWTHEFCSRHFFEYEIGKSCCIHVNRHWLDVGVLQGFGHSSRPKDIHYRSPQYNDCSTASVDLQCKQALASSTR